MKCTHPRQHPPNIYNNNSKVENEIREKRNAICADIFKKMNRTKSASSCERTVVLLPTQWRQALNHLDGLPCAPSTAAYSSSSNRRGCCSLHVQCT